MKYILIVLGIILATFRCLAGDGGDINSPEVLPGTKLKIVVIEFQSPENRLWGRAIARMLSIEILGGIRGIRDYNVVYWDHSYDSDEITSELIDEIAKVHKATMIIWGEFYMQNDSVDVYAHLRIVIGPVLHESSFRLAYKHPNGFVSADMPSYQSNLMPIRLATSDLAEIASRCDQPLRIWARSDTSSRIMRSMKFNDIFILSDVDTTWAKISFSGDSVGCFRHRDLKSLKKFKGVTFLVNYLEGVMLYSSGSYESAFNTLNNLAISDRDSMVDDDHLALMRILTGLSAFHGEFQPPSLRIETAISNFMAARDLISYEASPVNYSAVAWLAGMMGYSKGPLRIVGDYVNMKRLSDSIESNLIDVSTRLGDMPALRNLIVSYRMAPYSFSNRMDIAERAAILKDVLLDNYSAGIDYPDEYAPTDIAGQRPPITLIADKDAYFVTGKSDSNYNKSGLKIGFRHYFQYDSSEIDYYTVVHFALPNSIKSSDISLAVLYLTRQSGSEMPGRRIAAQYVESDWDETNIQSALASFVSHGGKILSKSFRSRQDAKGDLQLEVTDAVKKWLDQPTTNYGILLYSEIITMMHYELLCTFYDRENGIGDQRPRLIILFK